jgi:hypothetical protein
LTKARQTPTRRRPRAAFVDKTKSIKNVDMEILVDVYEDAMKRLKTVQREERLTQGASTTTLAMIGRNAILHWRPLPGREYEPTPRSPNGAAPDRTPFRFRMGAQGYREAQERIHQHGISVTQVVEEALIRFARTGL